MALDPNDPMPDEPMPSDAAEAAAEETALIRALVRRRSSAVHITLDEDEEDKLAQRVMQDFNDGIGENQIFRQLHVEMLQNWRGTAEPKDFPFPNASNIKVPMTSFFIEQTKARLLKALLGDTTCARFSSLDESIDKETLEELNAWFDYELKEVVDIERVLEDVLSSTLLDGFDLPMASYVHEERRLHARRDFDLLNDMPLAAQLLQAVQAVFADVNLVAVRNTGDGVYDVRFTHGKSADERTGHVEFSIDGAILTAHVERDEITFDGVQVFSPPLERIVIVNTGPDIEKIPFFGLQEWYGTEEFRTACTDGRFRSFTEEEIEGFLRGATEKQGQIVLREWSDVLDIEEGTDTRDPTANDPHRRWVEVYRWEGAWPMDGEHRKLVVWVETSSQKILRIAYQEDLNKDGKRSPVKFDFIRQKDRFYSLGLAEWVRHVQAELDAIHNQRLDAGLIANVPFGFYEPGAGLDKNLIQLEPGKMYPVKDVSKISFPKMSWSPMWSFNEEGMVRRYGQEQAGLGDPAIGSMPSKRTTASEFVGTQGAIDLRTELIVRGLLRSFRELLWRIFGLYQQYMPDGRVFLISGVDGEKVVRQFKRDRLHGRLVLHLTGDVAKISAQMERDVSVNMLSLMMNELLFQMGVVKPDTVYAALEKVVRAFGYKGVPIHKPDMPPESDPPMIEHKKMWREEYVAPSPTENFGEHLAQHIQLASDPVVDTWTPQARGILAQHIKATQDMQQMVQMMRQQQSAMAAQMRNNMAQQGVRPGLAGGQQAGQQAEPATQEEGMQGPEAPPEQMGTMQ